jgi:hypothetical protein
MQTRLALFALTLVLAACARNPESIAPMTMPVNAYSGLSCQQLAEEHRRSSLALAQVESQQRQAATGDAVGVFLIGVPVSSLGGGNVEGQVAQRKGELVSIEAQQRQQRCPVGS